jgi:hypothetical protein
MIDALPDAACRIVGGRRDSHGRLTGGHTYAVDDQALRPSERKVAAALAALLGSSGVGAPGLDRVSALAAVAPERVSAAMRKLERLGLIHRAHRYGHHVVDRITLIAPEWEGGVECGLDAA